MDEKIQTILTMLNVKMDEIKTKLENVDPSSFDYSTTLNNLSLTIDTYNKIEFVANQKKKTVNNQNE